MENFFTDNDDIQFLLDKMDLQRVVELREDNYCEKDKFGHAPSDYEDAMDSYKKVLSIIGEICGEQLAPLAPEIDEQGVCVKNGEVVMADGIQKAWDMFAKADLMGFCLPRKYGGLNFPAIILTIAAEICARADASFLNFGLQQDNAETLNQFGSEEQKERILPQLCSGEKGSAMVLTEPDAGSDLQAVQLKAHQGPDGKWYLNGVKRFITNGNGQVHLVLARSEEGVSGARGLSFFLYERDEHMKIRRTEHKLGIHGSPTCELQYNDAPAELIGERKRGLTKYTMWLMNKARLGISAQAVGIAEAAYREAYKYASEREQFGSAIINLIPVKEMLTEMKIAIEAGRTLLYETARIVDIKDGLEHQAEKYPDKARELKSDLKKYTRLAAFFTPITKAYTTEMCNKVSYDGIQIHGGTGYMKEFNAERHYRDARITNIYEGTTQLQVVAAINGVTSGTAVSVLNEWEEELDFSETPELFALATKSKNNLEKTIIQAKGEDSSDFITFHSRRLVEMATKVLISYLLLQDAQKNERKRIIAKAFINKASHEIENTMNYIVSGERSLMNEAESILS